MLLPIHIAAGALAIVLGAAALIAKKGGTIHRRSGLLFVYATLVMGISASILGLRNGLADGNVVAGVMTAYFVGTALTTVRPPSPWTRRLNAAALTLAVGLALVAIAGGIENVNSSRLSPGGVPFRTIGVMEKDRQFRRSVLLRVDAHRARRDRGLLRHPFGARNLESATNRLRPRLDASGRRW